MSEILDILRDGSLPAGELTARLGVSPATLMRRVRAAGGAVVTMGASRATRYGLRREMPDWLTPPQRAIFAVPRQAAIGRSLVCSRMGVMSW